MNSYYENCAVLKGFIILLGREIINFFQYSSVNAIIKVQYIVLDFPIGKQRKNKNYRMWARNCACFMGNKYKGRSDLKCRSTEGELGLVRTQQWHRHDRTVLLTLNRFYTLKFVFRWRDENSLQGGGIFFFFKGGGIFKFILEREVEYRCIMMGRKREKAGMWVLMRFGQHLTLFCSSPFWADTRYYSVAFCFWKCICATKYVRSPTPALSLSLLTLSSASNCEKTFIGDRVYYGPP